jgi:hypothetical protein
MCFSSGEVFSVGYLKKNEIFGKLECENRATAMAVFGIRGRGKVEAGTGAGTGTGAGAGTGTEAKAGR